MSIPSTTRPKIRFSSLFAKEWTQITLLLAPIGIAGAAFMGWLTPFGVGIYVDTLYYISSARNLIAGIGFGRISGLGVFKPYISFPPLYSLVLAFFQLLGLPALSAARWISIIAFGLSVILVGLIVYQRTNSRSFSLFCSILTLLSNPILHNFSWAMTEPLYIVLMLASLFLFASYFHTPLRRWLILTAIFASLAFLTRFIGIALVGALCLALILNRQIAWHRRMQDLAIFLSITLIPSAAWLVRNWLVSENLTNRVLAWHPITSQNLELLIKAVNGWGVIPQRLMIGHETLAFAGIVVGFAVVGLTWLWRSFPRPGNAPTQEFTMLWASWIYVGVLGISLFFLDATIRLENRILLPLYMLILILMVIASALLWQRKSLLIRLAVLLICLWFAYFSFTRVDGAIIDLRSDGQGYASQRWQNSPTAAFIRQQSTSVIYTNDITAIYFLTGKDSVGIPNENATESDLAQMRANLSTPDSYLVIFGTLTGEFAPLEKLTSGLTLVSSFEDGKIYQLH